MKFEKYFDHTILKPDATKKEVYEICKQAKEHGFASVCVNEYYAGYVKELLAGTDIAVCVVVGFPLGAVSSEIKSYETKSAVSKGADEIDMVINVGALKDKDYEYVENDIRTVRNACEGKVLKVIIAAVSKGADEIDMVINVGALKDKDYEYVENDIRTVRNACEGKVLKVIIETCLLNEEEKIKACDLAVKAGADFVKTSTGFSSGGATLNDVALMKKTVGNKAKVKASGGIRDYNTADAMISAGADRLGTSATVKIINMRD